MSDKIDRRQFNPGRPRKFKTPEELAKLIDDYFLTRQKEKKPFTVTSLALALDISREQLLKYEEVYEEPFRVLVKRAKERCEAYAEEQLYEGKNVAGVIFSMTNNYNWNNSMQHRGDPNNPIIHKYEQLTDEQLQKVLEERGNSLPRGLGRIRKAEEAEPVEVLEPLSTDTT